MMQGFFSSSELTIKAPASLLPQCGACGLWKKCESPKMKVQGKGRKGILIIGDSPNFDEDQQGRLSIGDSGRLLRDSLSRHGIDLMEDCWVTSSIICKTAEGFIPKKDNHGYQWATPKQIGYCRPNLTNALRDLEPSLIIPMGPAAVKALIGHVWKEDVGPIGRWVGWQIPSMKPNVWICPNYHPFDINRMGDTTSKLLFNKYLAAALTHTRKPWDDPPDYTKKVRKIWDHEEAAGIIREIMSFGKPVSFDYETDRLKPDHAGASIVCCSLYDGHTSFSFPWLGKATEAMRVLLRSEIPKYGTNCKFEDRWTHRILGCRPKNWVFDTMIGAHWLDNRGSIASLKFQAFVLLGVLSYDDHIKPYLKSKDDNSNASNRIREISMDDLLLYCGLDSIMTYKLAKKMMPKEDV